MTIINTHNNQILGTIGNVHGTTVVADCGQGVVVRTDSGKRLPKRSKLRCCERAEEGSAYRGAGLLPAPAWASLAMSRTFSMSGDMRRQTPAERRPCGSISI